MNPTDVSEMLERLSHTSKFVREEMDYKAKAHRVKGIQASLETELVWTWPGSGSLSA